MAGHFDILGIIKTGDRLEITVEITDSSLPGQSFESRIIIRDHGQSKDDIKSYVRARAESQHQRWLDSKAIKKPVALDIAKTIGEINKDL